MIISRKVNETVDKGESESQPLGTLAGDVAIFDGNQVEIIFIIQRQPKF